MKVEMRSVESLLQDPANVRLHSRRNIDSIKASLLRFGQQKPIIVDETGVVRAGNGTLEAARELEWEEMRVVVSDLEGIEMTAFAIADNRTAELAEWDYENLGAALRALEDGQAEELGWMPHELTNILAADWTPADPSGDLGDFVVPVPEPGVEEVKGEVVTISFSPGEVEIIDATRLVWSPDEEITRHDAIVRCCDAVRLGVCKVEPDE